MGTDFLDLFDRSSAELIIRGDVGDLVSLVESRNTTEGPPVWKDYWDMKQETFIDFPRRAKPEERLKTKLDQGTSLQEIKDNLLWELCTSKNFLHLDYWGCWVEAFPPEGAPGAILWEDFTAPMCSAPPARKEEWETSGRYLMTDDNVAAIIRSLETHQHELTIMGPEDVEHVHRWRAFCRKQAGFCVLYQMDF